MQIHPEGANRATITAEHAPGIRVFCSYSTPVAAIIHGEAFVTSRFYSVTTDRHIKRWRRVLRGANPEIRFGVKSQAFFDALSLALGKEATPNVAERQENVSHS